jgi:hypothetical protein
MTTLQDPTWEVRTRAQLIEAAQKAIGLQPEVADIAAVPPPATPRPPAGALALLNTPADQILQSPNCDSIESILAPMQPVRKAAKPRPPLKPDRHSKPVQHAAVI